MSAFKEQMRQRQIDWRRRTLPAESQGFGSYRRRRYPHLLQTAHAILNFWPGILGAENNLLEYLVANDIQRHTQSHNLLSSWALCANLYFPFRRDPDVIAAFLREHVDADIAEVLDIELEFTFEGDLAPAALLGEAGGSRGSGQTSPDVAFLVRTKGGGSGLVLVECKFTESSFYSCSANRGQRGRERNPEPDRCERALRVIASPETECHQATWGRRYWDHLRPRAGAFRGDSCCPAVKSGYQLFRQQALAEGAASSGNYELVVSGVAFDERNVTLRDSLRSVGCSSIAEWGELWEGRAKFRTFTHQSWVRWVRAEAKGSRWEEWLDYVTARYGIT